MKTVAFALICFSTTVFASNSGSHHSAVNNKAVLSSSEVETSWQATADLVYRQKTAPIILGFLPVNQHDNTAGLKLEHFDMSYELNNYKPSFNNNSEKDKSELQLNTRIDVSWHSNSVELKQAWLQNEWSQTEEQNTALKIGQYIPRIGFLNHQHHQGFLTTPLVNRTYWGEQMSEAGVELEHAINTQYWQVNQFANVLGGSHLNSNNETLAYLYQIEFNTKLSDSINVTLLGNYYQASVKDRGVLLFDLTNTGHTHSNSKFSEFFDGTVEHISAGIAFDLQAQTGLWKYQVEYSQRQEQGRIFSDSVNFAQLDLNSQGSYQQIHWQSNKKNWQAGIRHNYLYSDAEVSDTSDNSLDTSRLNNKDQTPQTFELMLGYAFASQQTVQLLFSDNIDWKEYQSRFEMHYQIQLH